MSIPGDTAKRAGMRQVIWDELSKLGPSTGSEISVALERRPEVIRPRLTELLELGEIRDTGARRRGGPRGPAERVFDIVHKRDQMPCATCGAPLEPDAASCHTCLAIDVEE